MSDSDSTKENGERVDVELDLDVQLFMRDLRALMNRSRGRGRASLPRHDPPSAMLERMESAIQKAKDDESRIVIAEQKKKDITNSQ